MKKRILPIIFSIFIAIFGFIAIEHVLAEFQLTNSGATVDEGNSVIISNAVLSVTDTLSPTSAFTYTILDAPDNGNLRNNLTILSLNDTFTQGDIDANLIDYLHDGSETTTDSFEFNVTNGLTVVLTGTFNITITSTNDGSSISFSGTETEDQTLSSSIVDIDGVPGSVSYQWQRSANGTSGWINIVGATNANYTLGDNDVDQYVRVTASYIDNQGFAETPVSSASGQIANINDTPSLTFSGTETEDQTLSSNLVDNDGVPGSVSYQWQRSANGTSGWANIAGATNANYTLGDDDASQYVRVIASYTDVQGTPETPVSSASGQIVNVNDPSSISFSGTETEDQTLSSNIVDIDGVPGSVSYQWQRSANGTSGWANIAGATNANYTLGDDDAGQYVRVTASFTDNQGSAETPVSAASGQIVNINDTPSLTFSGTETEDQTLSSNLVDNDGVPGSVSYQWQRSANGTSGWANIAGATNANYTLGDDDVDQYVRVTANYTDVQGTPETPVSSASGQIANINDTPSLTFSGTETEDQTLSSNLVDNDGVPGSVSYQWQRSANGTSGWTNIAGATNANYTLGDDDVNQYVRVTANYTDVQGTPETPVSSASGQIVNVNDPSSISFSGTETEDQTLSSNIVDIEGVPGSVSYQWQRSANGTSGWANIAGATNANYTLGDDDAGQYVRVTASFIDNQGSAETPVSAASGQIVNINDPSSIVIVGTETEDQTLFSGITDNDGVPGSVSYQWQRSPNGSTGWTNIAGAINANYTLGDDDVDQYVRVTANYTDVQGTPETPVSSASGQIANINDTPSLTFSGTETEDQTLSSNLVDNDGLPGSISYQWQRSPNGSTGWASISGATNANYTLGDDDVDQYVRIIAAYTDNQGELETPISSASGQIANINDTPSLTFSGTETEDQTLSSNLVDNDGLPRFYFLPMAT